MITFNGFYLGDYLDVKSIDRGGIIPAREIDYESIPQMAGAVRKNVKTGIRIIKVTIKITGSSEEDLRKRVETIGEILKTDDDAPIIFDDEPDRIYYGMLYGETPLTDTLQFGKGEINFLCLDPHKYGAEEELAFDSDGVLNFFNTTNSDIFPRYEIAFNQPATFFSILDAENQITIGEPEEVTKAKVPREQLIMTEGFNSMTGWSATNVAVDGTVLGTIGVNAQGNFVPTSFGTGTGWHGPALKKSLPEELQDFKMELYLENKSTGGKTVRNKQIGRAELYLLDINDLVIAKFAILDQHTSYEKTFGEARLGAQSGGKYIINYVGNNSVWNNFDGRIYIERIGKRWLVTIGKWDGKRHYARLSKGYYDADNAFNQKVAKVQVHFGAYDAYPTTTMLFDIMYIKKINTVLTVETPYIVDTGDIVEVDTFNGGIYKNGDPWMKELDQVSDWFSLKPGSTVLEFYPEGVTSSIKAFFSKRWQ